MTDATEASSRDQRERAGIQFAKKHGPLPAVAAQEANVHHREWAVAKPGPVLRHRRRQYADAELPVDHNSLGDVVVVDELLGYLEKIDPRQGRLVELRFFAGLTEEETAEAMGISSATFKREWRSAKAWLTREMPGERLAVERPTVERPAVERPSGDLAGG